MGDSRRVSRMAHVLRSELSRILIHEISDPRLREVVITDVNVSRDLMSARVFIAAGGATKEAKRGLERAAPFFRRRLGEHLALRYVPTLDFQADLHADQAMRLERLLGELKTPPPDQQE